MSRVVGISLGSHTNDLGGKIWNPAIRWTKKHSVFVTLEDESGARGIGECWCFDTAPDALLAFLRTEVVPHFLGAELAEVPEICARLTRAATLTARHGILASALSGVDIAAWDLRAKLSGKPVWQLLDDTRSGSVQLYASGGLYGLDKSKEQLGQEMAGFAGQGFSLSKMKVGGMPLEDDIARVNAVLAVLPQDASLIIDAVYSYSADQAQQLYDALPEGRIAAFQSPVAADDLKGMRQLGDAGIAVLANEAEYRAELHTGLIEEARVAYLQVAPVACGGISRVMAMNEQLQGIPTRLSLEVSSTAVAMMAACHLAAANSAIAHVEYHSVHTVFFDRLALSWRKQTPGVVQLPDVPGLGIELSGVGLDHQYHADAPDNKQEPYHTAV